MTPPSPSAGEGGGHAESAGTSSEVAASLGCSILGVSYPNMAPNPSNPCQRCDATRATDAWSPALGAPCDDGLFCNGVDSCHVSGKCEVHTGNPCPVQLDECMGCNEEADRCGVLSRFTFYDPSRDLVWEMRTSRDGTNWQAAMDGCATLSFCGRSDWRLPTISELRSLVRGCPGTEAGGSCQVTDRCTALSCYGSECSGCALDSGPRNDGAYCVPELRETVTSWSSSVVADEPSEAWVVNYSEGAVERAEKTDQAGTDRCVRTGKLE